jgi:hypothetical protein
MPRFKLFNKVVAPEGKVFDAFFTNLSGDAAIYPLEDEYNCFGKISFTFGQNSLKITCIEWEPYLQNLPVFIEAAVKTALIRGMVNPCIEFSMEALGSRPSTTYFKALYLQGFRVAPGKDVLSRFGMLAEEIEEAVKKYVESKEPSIRDAIKQLLKEDKMIYERLKKYIEQKWLLETCDDETLIDRLHPGDFVSYGKMAERLEKYGKSDTEMVLVCIPFFGLDSFYLPEETLRQMLKQWVEVQNNSAPRNIPLAGDSPLNGNGKRSNSTPLEKEGSTKAVAAFNPSI